MDAPPEREDCKPFVKVAALMRAAGVHVPEVIAQDLERGFLLLSDLGTTTYLKALDDARTRTRFSPTRSMRCPLAAREPARTCCRRTTKRC